MIPKTLVGITDVIGGWWARHPFLKVLAQKDFTLLWSAQVMSTLGDQFTYIALAILVLKTTGSALQVGLMFAVTTVPNILFGLIAGVFVDRWDRRRTMITCDILRVGIIAAIPWLIHLHLGLVYAALFISTAASRFFRPARVASIPHIVPEEQLVSANALDKTGVEAGRMIGYSLAGVIISWYGATVAFFFDATTFLLSALALSAIVIPYTPRPQGSGRSITQIKLELIDGLRYIWRNSVLRVAMGLALVAPLGMGLLNALLVVFALRVLGTTEAGYGLLETSIAAGVVLAGLIIGSFGDSLKRSAMMMWGLAGLGLSTILLAFSPSLMVAMGVMLLSGLANGVSLVGLRTLLQEQTPPEYRGRVSGAWMTAVSTSMVLGMSLTGLADVLPVRPIMAAAGMMMALTGLVGAQLPHLRNV